MWFESSPSGMVTMLCWASRSQLNRDIYTASLLDVFSAHQTAELPKSTLDSGGLVRHLVRKGTRGLNYGSIIISSWVVLCRQHVDSSHHFTGSLIQKERRNTPKMSRTSKSSWLKRVSFWPHNRVHPITDSTEGTVEIFSWSSFKNENCSMFRAWYLRKKNHQKY